MRCSGKTSKFVPQLHDEVNFRCVFVNFVQFDDIWMVQLHIRANLCHQGAYFCGHNHSRTEISTRISFLRSSSRVCMDSHAKCLALWLRKEIESHAYSLRFVVASVWKRICRRIWWHITSSGMIFQNISPRRFRLYTKRIQTRACPLFYSLIFCCFMLKLVHGSGHAFAQSLYFVVILPNTSFFDIGPRFF